MKENRGSNWMRRSRLSTSAAVLVLLFLFLAADCSASNKEPLVSPEALQGTDWWSTVQQNIRDQEYHVTWQEKTALSDIEAAWQAPNRAQNLRTFFTSNGIALVRRTDAEPSWDARLILKGIGRGGEIHSLPEDGNPKVSGSRIEYHRGDVVEWYENRPDGVEQGFTLQKKPEGEGLLEIELVVQGSAKPKLSQDGSYVDFLTDSNVLVLRYDKLKVNDAEGKILLSHFEVSANSVKIVCEENNAKYPVIIDPLITSPDWTVENDQNGSGFGFSLGTAGDVNNDGYSDVIVGAPYYDCASVNEGRAYIYFGSPAGASQNYDWKAEATFSGAFFGTSVGTAGDINNDGYGDIIIGAPGHSSHGKIFVYFGSAQGPGDTPDKTIEGLQENERFGSSAGTAGDINNDGYSDIIVGSPQWDDVEATDEGRVYIYYGPLDEMNPTIIGIEENNQDFANFGTSVGTAGDVNGDGFSDIIVGAHQYIDSNRKGKAFVFLGGADGLNQTVHWSVMGDQADSRFGASVGTAGDVNNDGFSDIIIGAPEWDNANGNEGKSFAYYGSSSGLTQNADWTTTGMVPSDLFGSSVNTAGDVNGDGFSDIIVGAPGRGLAYLYFGSSMGLSRSSDMEFSGSVSQFGAAVKSAGDVNGDGYSDIIIGAPESYGKAFLYYGSSTGPNSTADWAVKNSYLFGNLGCSVGTAGDVNGDGFDDIIVGSIFYDNDQYDEGRAILYFGSSGGPEQDAAWSVESDQMGSHFGASVGTAGDVNGDGYSDIIIGAPKYSSKGMVFVYHGSPEIPNLKPDWSAIGENEGDEFGSSVGTAGDVNGDDFSDIIIGAPGFDIYYDDWTKDDDENAGKAYVYFGSDKGLSQYRDWEDTGEEQNASFGMSVAAAGDIDNDGYDEIIVGSPNYSDLNNEFITVGKSRGKVYVYSGSSIKLESNLSWSFLGEKEDDRFGFSVSTAGHFNGDEYSDIIIGAPYYSNNNSHEVEGKVYLLYGSNNGVSVNNYSTFKCDNCYQSEFGYSVGTAGDVNNDGYSDIIVGAPAYDGGKLFLYYGPGFTESVNWSVEPLQGYARFAQTIGTAGDVNGDGYSDIIAGAPKISNVFVYFGHSQELSNSAAWTAKGYAESFSDLGFSVGTAGDVNGDGFGDVIIGAPNYDSGQNDVGMAFIFLGSSGGLTDAVEWSVVGEQADAKFGFSVSTAGDNNGDGYSDVIIGAPFYDANQNDNGMAYLYMGSSDGPALTSNWIPEINLYSSRYGFSVGTAGDVNGDGFNDIIVGAPSGEMAFVYYGSSEGPGLSADWSATNNLYSSEFGTSVGTAGDVNGDGYSDIMVGSNGNLFIYHGSPAGLNQSVDWSANNDQQHNYSYNEFGVSAGSAGDINGDGFSDIIVGAPNAGMAFVFNGSPNGLDQNAAWMVNKETDYGASVCTAGDVNGDGYNDILIGSPIYSDQNYNAGRVSLYYGSFIGLNSNADWTAVGNKPYANFGWSASTAGDINGDGFSDFIIGAPNFDNFQKTIENVYVYYGNGGGYESAKFNQFKTDIATNISFKGISDSESAFVISATLDSTSITDQTEYQLECEVKPAGFPLDGTDTIISAEWHAPLTQGNRISLSVNNLIGHTAYQWRARLRYSAPNPNGLLVSRWFYPYPGMGTSVRTNNNPPKGGFAMNDSTIPSAQISQTTDASGIVTIQFRLKDQGRNLCRLHSFQYSTDGGTIWKSVADASGALGNGWPDNNGQKFTSFPDWTGEIHSFTFNTRHLDVAADLENVEQEDFLLRFLINDGLDDSEPVNTAYFRLDNKMPDTGTITIVDNDEFTNQKTPTIHLSTSDLSPIKMRLAFNKDDLASAEWQDYAETIDNFDISGGGDGNKTIYVEFMDVLGNIQTTHASDSTLYDTVPPYIGVIFIVDSMGATNDPTPELNISAIGADWMRFALNDKSALEFAEWIRYTPQYSEFDISAGGSGEKRIWVQFKDNAGNILDASFSAITIYDTIPPSPPLVSGSTPTNKTTPTWTWTSIGGDGAGIYRHNLDNSDINTATETPAISHTPTSPLTPGEHTLYVWERDYAGNWSSAGTHTIQIDMQKPDPPRSLDLAWYSDTGFNNGDNITRQTQLTFTGFGEEGSTIRLYDRGEFIPGASVVVLSGYFSLSVSLSPGIHDITATQTNKAGNTSDPTSLLQVVIDITPPGIPTALDLAADSDTGVSSTDNHTRKTAGLIITGTGETGNTVQLYDNGNLISGLTGIVTQEGFRMEITLIEGEHLLTAVQSDPAGNPSAPSEPLTLVIHATPPAPPASLDLAAEDDSGVSASDNETHKTDGITITGTGDPGNGIQIYSGGIPITSGAEAVSEGGTFSAEISLSEGIHSLTGTQSDLYGNRSAASSPLSVRVDLTPPNPPYMWSLTPLTNNASPEWRWSPGGGGNGTFDYELKKGDAIAETGEISATRFIPEPLSDGIYTLSVQERDNAGNRSAPGTFTIEVDQSLPAAPAVQGISPTNIATPTWHWTSGGEGTGTFRYKLDDDDLTLGAATTRMSQFTPASILSEGNHAFYVQELDPAGNWSSSGAFAIEVDTGMPCTTALSPDVVDDTGMTFTISYTHDDGYAGESCGDAASGSGIGQVELWVRGPGDTVFIKADTDTEEDLDGKFTYMVSQDRQGAYEFYTLAQDRAGNREIKRGPDTRTVYVSAFSGYAILGVGAIAGEEGLPSHTLTANNIYKHLVSRNFALVNDPTERWNDPMDHIKYLNPYAEPQMGEDEYTGSYKSALQQAITVWAPAKMAALSGPLYIILIDHGSPETFYLTGTERLLSEELNDWLKILENAMSAEGIEEDIVLILGTCYAGSFIDNLSKPGRIIISSTAPGEVSYRGSKDPGGVRDGEFFLTALFNELGQGNDLAESFKAATAASEIHTDSGTGAAQAPYFDGAMQHPMLDDNGDGQGSNDLGEDGRVAALIRLGHDTGAPAPVSVTAAGAIPFQPLLPGESQALLWAQVSETSRADAVWAEIREPGLLLEKSAQQQAVDLVEQPMTFNPGTGRYEVTHYGFLDPGRYALFFYVRDKMGMISPFQMRYLYKGLEENLPPSEFGLNRPEDRGEPPTTLLLDWNDAVDPEGDTVTYTVWVSAGDPGFSDPLIFDGLSRSLLRLAEGDGLTDATQYYWKVFAVDDYGASTESPVRTFTTNNNNPVAAWFTGHIFNTATGASISGAGITFQSSSNSSSFSTDAAGYYIDELTPQTYTITASAGNYSTATAEGISAPAGEVTAWDMGLDPIQSALPRMSPEPGTYDTYPFVTLASAAGGAIIRYTLDGTDPDGNSPVYSGPIQLTATATIKARAYESGLPPSEVVQGHYAITISDTLPAPGFSPPAGTYTGPQQIQISCSVPGTTLHYTIDGTVPTESSPIYTSPVSVTETRTLKARAYKTGWFESETATAHYTLIEIVAQPVFSPAPGIYTGALSVAIATATPGAAIRYTIDGAEPTEAAPLYTGPISIDGDTTLKGKAFKTGMSPSPLTAGTYGITGTVAAPVFSLEPGVYEGTQTVTMTCSTPDAEIRYSLDGSTPTVDSPRYTAPVAIAGTTWLKAIGVKTDWISSDVREGYYTIAGTVSPPVFSPAPGVYSTAQSVALSCETSGAVIRYTLDGNEPTEISQIYLNPIPVPMTRTIKAKAFLPNAAPSATTAGRLEIIPKGDLNGDGVVDLSDVITGLKVLAGVDVAVRIEGDMDGNGRIDHKDLVMILWEVSGR